jgi:hypothetical protein
LHAAIDKPAAAGAARAETLPRRKFGAAMILCAGLRIARRQRNHAHRNDRGGNDDGAHGFFPLHRSMRIKRRKGRTCYWRMVSRVIHWYMDSSNQ